jgi:UMP-CMP kinase
VQAGDLLRDERLKANATSALIEQHIAAGQPVPIDVTVGLLHQAINAWRARGRHLFLLDDFPRNQGNLDGWNRGASDINVALALFLDAPEQIMEQRCIKRGALSGRAEDSVENKKKFLHFVEATLPIIAHFEKLGKTQTVNAADAEDVVYAEVRAVFQTINWQE